MRARIPAALRRRSVFPLLYGADCGATSAFSAWLGARLVQQVLVPQTPRRHWRQRLTDATTRIWCCTHIENVDWSSGSESQIEKKKEYECGRTAGLHMVRGRNYRQLGSRPPHSVWSIALVYGELGSLTGIRTRTRAKVNG